MMKALLKLWLLLFFLLTLTVFPQSKKWYEYYQDGLNAMKAGDYAAAVQHFQNAIKLKEGDKKKIRAFGTVFIEYFPHRELGICYYYLGDYARARQELELSLSREKSRRAEEYLQYVLEKTTSPTPPAPAPVPPATTEPTPPQPEAIPQVGERMSIAVLPFESKGIGGSLGDIDLLDKLITAFVNLGRFKVVERAQLEKVLEEQKLALSGIIDASTAAQIGRGLGVDAVVVGSITRSGQSVTIDARLIDAETAAILTAKDAFSQTLSLPALTQMISQVAQKIQAELPLISGYVVRVDGDQVILDKGFEQGLKKGMKCIVFREGAPIVHPVTGEVLGKTIEELCEVRVEEVFNRHAVAEISRLVKGKPQAKDKFITK